jgi:tryptophanyl-tRNA synthetase
VSKLKSKVAISVDIDVNRATNDLKLDEATVEQKITPWDVKGQVIDGVEVGIDYSKLMNQFGCRPIEEELVRRLERQTGCPVHPLLRRGAFYCHRDLEKILDLHAAGKPFYLYTGRGPSSESMHLGHMIPFLFCKYLQDAFNCFLVIQMTDDEKFLFKEALTLEQCKGYAFENSKDIIAVGFNPEKTFIFPNTTYMGQMFETVLRVQKLINLNQACSTFGFTESDAIGKIAFPATQIAPSFSEAFPHLFGGKKDVPCLIPYAIDQDPYFRLCRDIAPRLKLHKPASICSVFFPALQGFHTKMSASSENSAIFMTDTPKQIETKLNKYAFSGGKATLEEQRELGADLSVDIPYQYLRFFLHDDAEIERVAAEYTAGRMLTGEVKKLCATVLKEFVAAFQERRAKVTDDIVRQFMDFSKPRY